MPETQPLPYVDPYARRGFSYRLACAIAISRFGMWMSQHVAWKLDPALLRLSGGRLSMTGQIASALLETRGARSGRPRRNATLYFNDGERVIIVASYMGRPEHPAWYHNLKRNPDVRFGGHPFRAEEVEDPAERQRLWSLADQVFPPFARYRDWAHQRGREIPLIALTPES